MMAPTPLEILLADRVSERWDLSKAATRAVAEALADYRERILSLMEPHVRVEVEPMSRPAFEIRAKMRALRVGL